MKLVAFMLGMLFSILLLGGNDSQELKANQFNDFVIEIKKLLMRSPSKEISWQGQNRALKIEVELEDNDNLMFSVQNTSWSFSKIRYILNSKNGEHYAIKERLNKTGYWIEPENLENQELEILKSQICQMKYEILAKRTNRED